MSASSQGQDAFVTDRKRLTIALKRNLENIDI